MGHRAPYRWAETPCHRGARRRTVLSYEAIASAGPRSPDSAGGTRDAQHGRVRDDHQGDRGHPSTPFHELVEQVKGVEGVVAVDADLSWQVDDVMVPAGWPVV